MIKGDRIKGKDEKDWKIKGSKDKDGMNKKQGMKDHSFDKNCLCPHTDSFKRGKYQISC